MHHLAVNDHRPTSSVHLTLGRPDTRKTVDDFWQHGVKEMEHSRTTENENDAGAGGIECPSDGHERKPFFPLEI
jgi:hypothetical protein